jgi:dGTP triphosphohydrolase
MSSDHGKDEYYALCKHIAKARIIADYIASMTDRMAEKNTMKLYLQALHGAFRIASIKIGQAIFY